MTRPTSPPAATPSYVQRLLQELESFSHEYAALLERSSIVNVDRNARGSGLVFVGNQTRPHTATM
jgi:hypothetical protein